MTITGPKQTIIVTSRGIGKFQGREKECQNLITLDWHMMSSMKPPMYSICLGKTRFSLSLIQKSKVFCVNYVGEEFLTSIKQIGSTSGEHTDKFIKFNIEKEECDTIDCPRIKKCLSYLECEVVNEIESGDHIIIIGKINKAKSLSDGKRIFNIDSNDFITI